MATADATNWVQMIGYQHEVIHTGVLHHLLSDEARGAEVASELLDRDVKTVRDTKTQAKLPGFKRVPDLVAKLELADGGFLRLAVETKVDSSATPEQLKEEAAPPRDHGVLFALGITALAVTCPRPWGLDGWTVVTPRAWATVLGGQEVDRDPVIGPYFSQVTREADEHDCARKLAHRPMRNHCHLEARGRSNMLGRCAWLAETRAGLDDQPHWWMTIDRSGPSMQLGDRPSFPIFGRGVVTLVQIMCSTTSRRLCLKVGRKELGADVQLAAERARAAVRGSLWQVATRAVSASARYITAARIDLTELGAQDAAGLTRQAILGLERCGATHDE